MSVENDDKTIVIRITSGRLFIFCCFQSMHWSTPKTKDRMLESGGSSGPSSLGSSAVSAAHRRASEGGANLHWGGRGAGSAWGIDPPSEIVSKFRNYEI